MKKRNIVLGLLLSFVCAVSVFGLVGCGEASIKTISDNFKKLDDIYAQYDTIFVKDENHKVNFGAKIDGIIDSNDAEFVELEDLYNVALTISNQYIEQNRNYIEYGVKENDLDGDARKKLDEFNKNLVEFQKEIPTFVTQRAAFVNHFQNLSDFTSDNFDYSILQDFKMAFGTLVEKNVKLSTSFANAVEATRVYNALGEIALEPEDTGIVKEFICAKLLHIFTDLRISQISNNLMWSTVGKDTEGKNDKKLIDDLIEKSNNQFETFKLQFVNKSSGNYKQLTKDEYAKVFEMTNEFLVETKAYTQAVEDFKVTDFAENGAILQKHKEKNKFAEVYLEKMDQFLTITLPKFMSEVSKIMYA